MLNELIPIFVHFIPKSLEEGKLYISEEFEIAIHLCACGCGEQTVMPLDKGGWTMTKEPGDLITFSPSIGNFSGESPYHAHYFIRKNQVVWA